MLQTLLKLSRGMDDVQQSCDEGSSAVPSVPKITSSVADVIQDLRDITMFLHTFTWVLLDTPDHFSSPKFKWPILCGPLHKPECYA